MGVLAGISSFLGAGRSLKPIESAAFEDLNGAEPYSATGPDSSIDQGRTGLVEVELSMLGAKYDEALGPAIKAVGRLPPAPLVRAGAASTRIRAARLENNPKILFITPVPATSGLLV